MTREFMSCILMLTNSSFIPMSIILVTLPHSSAIKSIIDECDSGVVDKSIGQAKEGVIAVYDSR